MKWPLSQIASLIGAEIEGDKNLEIDDISKIEEGKKGSISFLANLKYEKYIYETEASAVIVSKEFQPNKALTPTLLRVEDPYGAFANLLQYYSQLSEQKQEGIDSRAFVHPEAKIAEKVFVGPLAYIGPEAVIARGAVIHPFAYIGKNVHVGEDSVVYPHVTIYRDCRIGRGCILHAGSVIGSDGFGFAPQEDGSFKKIPQTGQVILEEGVEIGANACIDRATLGATIIKKGAKVDNLVQIAHNVEIGENTVLAAQTGVAGSTRLGSYCMVGGQVGIVGHLEIADKTKIDAQSGVNRSIKKEGQVFRGSPIQPFRQQLKSEVLFRKLEELQSRIQQLENTSKENV